MTATAQRPARIRRPATRPWRSQRGALLLTALMFSAVIGLSLASYLRLATTSLNNANRTFYTTAATNIAECGIEEAMSALYRLTQGEKLDAAWSGWQRGTTDATRTFTGFRPGPNAQGRVKVLVKDYAFLSQPMIVAKGIVTLPDGATIEQMLEVKAEPRGLFARGLVARSQLICWASPTLDSWNSDPDNNPATAPVPYSTSAARANTAVACASAENGAMKLKDARVYGIASTGGGAIEFGNSAVVSGTLGGSGIDPSRLRRDFTANFPEVQAPDIKPSELNLITSPPLAGTTFPRAGDKQAEDGKYYYRFGMGTRLSIDSNRAIYIAAPCVFVFQSHINVESITNKGDVEIASGASLVIYTNGHISSEGGNGFINQNNQPAACLIYGIDTDPGRQRVTIGGSSGGGVACYMPNANLTLGGQGSIAGAFVGYRIEIKSGSTAFHFDEALARYSTAHGGRIAGWRHLHSTTERATYASMFNF